MADRTEAMILECVKAAKMEAEDERKKEIIKRLDIYQDNYKELIEEEIDRQFAKETREFIKQLVADDQNVLKRIINEISLVYKKNAKRTASVGEGDEAKQDERYQEITDDFPFDIFMDTANQLTNLCNQTIVKISWRNGIQLDLLTPDRVDIYQRDDDPTQPWAIVYHETFINTKGNADCNYYYWDLGGSHRIFDKNYVDITKQVLGEEDPRVGENPFKDADGEYILPFVILNRRYMVDRIWDNTGGTDLVSGAMQAGVLLTYLNYLYKVNSFKQLAMTGVDLNSMPKELVLDPLYPKAVPNPEAKIQVLDYQGAIDKLMEIVNNKIVGLANNYGLSADMLRVVNESQSGYAWKMKKSSLFEARERQEKLYRWYEADIFEKIRIVNNTMGPSEGFKEISPEARFSIDFGEIEVPENPKEIRDNWSYDMANGAKSLLDYVRYRNPDLTEEEAENVLKKNVETNQRLAAETGLNLDALFQADEGTDRGAI